MSTPVHILNHPLFVRSYSFRPLDAGSYVQVKVTRGPRTVEDRRMPVGEARRLWSWLVKAHGYQTW